MAKDLVLREDAGGIATLTLNAPERLNALSDAMLAALKASFEAIGADGSVRVVILRGVGKAFCAGHDLKEMQAGRAKPDKGRAYFADLFARCAEVMQMIPALPQPVIAEVHGIATAAGCQLVGLFCSTPMVALSRNVPRKVAFEMLTTGGFIDAARAAEVGLVNRVVAADRLTAETRALADVVAAKLGAAVKIGKAAFYDQIGLDLASAYDHAGAVMVENMLWRDTDEGIAAFLDKRKPDWS